MITRSVLGAIDMNNSVNREQRKTKKGVPMYKIKSDRGSMKWYVCPIKEMKTYAWREDLMELIMEHARQGQVPDIEFPIDDSISTPKYPFSKEEIVKNHQSRLQLKEMEPLEHRDH